MPTWMAAMRMEPAGGQAALERIAPVMDLEGEAPDVRRGERHRLQIVRRLCGLLGIHVHVRPARVVLAGVQRDPVERPVLPAELGEVRRVARIAAEVDAALRESSAKPTQSDLSRVNVRPETPRSDASRRLGARAFDAHGVDS